MHGELLSFDQLPLDFITSVRDKSRTDAEAAEERRKGSGLFTASELHKLLTSKAASSRGATARAYICEKAWERLTGVRVDKGTGFRETEWGNEWEPYAIEQFSKDSGLSVEYTGKKQRFQKADGYPFGATPDGLIGSDAVVEVKCPFNGGIHLQNIRFASDPDWFRSERFDYFTQIQGALWASDRKIAYFISYDPGVSRDRDPDERITFEGFPESMRLFYTQIQRDESFIEILKGVVIDAEKEIQEILACHKKH